MYNSIIVIPKEKVSMSEILFSYESSPSFAGPYTARGRSVTVYADGSVAGCGVFTRMKKEAN